MSSLPSTLKGLLPSAIRRWVTRQTRWPRVGNIRPSDLRRTEPISRSWGGDRGRPVDRQYIERFLASRAADVRGHVLEFGDDTYARRFGGPSLHVDVADVSRANPKATMFVDLGTGDGMPESRFDCVVCTQTIHLIPDVGLAVAALRRSLTPGGVLLLTVPGISQTVSDDRNPWRDYWRFTASGLAHLLSKDFPSTSVDITTYGNVFTAIAFLHGIAAEELTPDELSTTDPSYPLIVAARATAP